MQKIVFLEFAELKQGDGLGPKYEAGKAYWLPRDHCNRWIGDGVAEVAPDDMPTENEWTPPPLYPVDVRIIRIGNGLYDVMHRDGTKFNEGPLDAGAAEVLRRQVMENGRPPVAVPLQKLEESAPLSEVSEAAPELKLEESAPEESTPEERQQDRPDARGRGRREPARTPRA